MADTVVCSTLVGGWPDIRGHELGNHYARVMQKMVAPYPFVLFADRAVPGIECYNNGFGGAGCMCKMAAFNPAVFPHGTRVVLTDLDNIITNLERVVTVPLDKPVCLDEFGTGFITFEAGPKTDHIWRLANLTERTARKWDDGILMQYGGIAPPRHSGAGGPNAPWREQWRTWSQVLPGRIWSYRSTGSADRHFDQSSDTLPAEMDAMFFWGNPRPHTVRAPWNPFYDRRIFNGAERTGEAAHG